MNQAAPTNRNKPIIFGIVIVLVAALIFYLRAKGFGFDSLLGVLAQVSAWQAEHPVTFVILFMLAYIVVAALSLPFSTWMTLAAGALFGFWQGTIIASFASTIGATLAFLTARYLLGDWAQNKLGGRAATVHEGMKRDGAFYLFTLRLIPILPFFAVNLLMGLAPIRVGVFYIVSQLGMLPATAVFVNAGTQLAALDGLGGILSPALILSFALLGLFPWIARKIVSIVQNRKVYTGFDKPKSFDRNMVVIGGGAAGLVSSYIAAAVRAKVTLVEGHKMGGDCLNFGCVPSKALIKSAAAAQAIRKGDHYGLTPSEPKIDFRKVMARVHDVIAKIEPHDSVERYQGLGVDVRQGYAKIIDPWRVEISHTNGEVETLTTKSIVIATGAAPFVPPLPGLDDVGYLTSDTLWEALSSHKTAPKRLVVLGGGPIGCELTQAFARLGSKVTQIEMAPRLMIREDADVSAHIEAKFKSEGVDVLTEHRATSCGVTRKKKWIEVVHGDETRKIEFDEIIVAVGRSARLSGFGLEELGIPTGRTVETNEFLETNFPNIYAAGDVVGPYQFTHVASHQAWFASVNALFGVFKRFKVDYRVIPWATFTDPEVARVGLSEQDAAEKGIEVEITHYGLDDLDRAIADGTDVGWVKVLTAPGKDKILGATIVGAHAGDLMAEFVLAMKHGLGLNKILGTIHTYPTMSEANKYAAGEWKRANVNPRVMALLERFHGWMRG